uniref:Uncharacterized protein n=1 Tax=Romanomermis culicivorax TaxID=13658 RepID=A0A915LA31_ROMCU
MFFGSEFHDQSKKIFRHDSIKNEKYSNQSYNKNKEFYATKKYLRQELETCRLVPKSTGLIFTLRSWTTGSAWWSVKSGLTFGTGFAGCVSGSVATVRTFVAGTSVAARLTGGSGRSLRSVVARPTGSSSVSWAAFVSLKDGHTEDTSMQYGRPGKVFGINSKYSHTHGSAIGTGLTGVAFRTRWAFLARLVPGRDAFGSSGAQSTFDARFAGQSGFAVAARLSDIAGRAWRAPVVVVALAQTLVVSDGKIVIGVVVGRTPARSTWTGAQCLEQCLLNPKLLEKACRFARACITILKALIKCREDEFFLRIQPRGKDLTSGRYV